MEWQQQLEVVGAVAYAMLLGGLVGFDRERKNRPAGFRTHMLVAAAAALLVGMGRLMVNERLAGPAAGLQIDPLRLVEAVVAGVAFIGAGTIFSQRQGKTVSGITTAASLLMVAVIGIAAGLNYHVLAASATLLTLGVLAGLKLLERHWRGRRAGPG